MSVCLCHLFVSLSVAPPPPTSPPPFILKKWNGHFLLPTVLLGLQKKENSNFLVTSIFDDLHWHWCYYLHALEIYWHPDLLNVPSITSSTSVKFFFFIHGLLF